MEAVVRDLPEKTNIWEYNFIFLDHDSLPDCVTQKGRKNMSGFKQDIRCIYECLMEMEKMLLKLDLPKVYMDFMGMRFNAVSNYLNSLDSHYCNKSGIVQRNSFNAFKTKSETGSAVLGTSEKESKAETDLSSDAVNMDCCEPADNELSASLSDTGTTVSTGTDLPVDAITGTAVPAESDAPAKSAESGTTVSTGTDLPVDAITGSAVPAESDAPAKSAESGTAAPAGMNLSSEEADPNTDTPSKTENSSSQDEEEVEFVGTPGYINLSRTDIPGFLGYPVTKKEMDYMRKHEVIVDPFNGNKRVPLHIGPMVPNCRFQQYTSAAGKASKAGISKQTQLLSLLNHTEAIKVEYSLFDEEWHKNHPDAIMLKPEISLEFREIPATMIPVIHICESAKDLVDLTLDEKEAVRILSEFKSYGIECGLDVEEESSDDLSNKSESDKDGVLSAEDETGESGSEDGMNAKKSGKGKKRRKNKGGRPAASQKIKYFKAQNRFLWESKSLVSPSLMASILYKKYCLYIPFYRQALDYRLRGLHVSDQTIHSWVKMARKIFEPIYLEMWSLLKGLDYIHADETYVYIQELINKLISEKSVLVGFTSGKYESVQLAMYFLRPNRKGEILRDYLDEDKNYHLLTDAFRSYFRSWVTNAVCHDHDRRHFVDVIKGDGGFNMLRSLLREAGGNVDDERVQNFLNGKGRHELRDSCEIVRIYKDIYRIESQLKDENASLEKILERRQGDTKVLLDKIYEIVESYSTDKDEAKKLGKKYAAPDSKMGKAIVYATNQKKYLYAFLDDPKFALSNGRQERQFLPVRKMRDNAKLQASVEGAETSAIFLSIIQTCLMNGVNPVRYLEYVLRNFDPENLDFLNRVGEFTPCSSSLPDYLMIDSEEDVPQNWKTEDLMGLEEADLYGEEILEFLEKKLALISLDGPASFVDEAKRERLCGPI